MLEALCNLQRFTLLVPAYAKAYLSVLSCRVVTLQQPGDSGYFLQLTLIEV